jgi:putative ABC transport system permease protein
MPPEPSNSPSFELTLASARTTMLFSEIVQLAIDSFKASKARFLLTMLGMIIGSASIVLVVTIGLTGKQYAIEQISNIGPNMVEMEYQGGDINGPNNTTTPDNMTYDDMTSVVAQVPGIVAASPMLEDHTGVSMGNGVVKDAMLLGVSPQYKQIRNLAVVAGRFFDDQDATTHAKVVVIVEPFARALFGTSEAAVDKSISIHGIPFIIIGVFKESINTFGISEISDQTLLIPYPVARYFTGTNTVKEIFFMMDDSASVVPASKQIHDIIQSHHYPNSVYLAFIMSGILSLMGRIADMLTIVLSLAAAITLVVAGVGIMNSMLANVQARIREIGIRKALGATSREIRLQFLIEAVFISLSGGIIGILLGLSVPVAVNVFAGIHIPISWVSVVVAVATSVLVGVGFGTLPANRAAHLDPVETLKYE